MIHGLNSLESYFPFVIFGLLSVIDASHLCVIPLTLSNQS